MKTNFNILYCFHCDKKFRLDDNICQLKCCYRMYHEDCEYSCSCSSHLKYDDNLDMSFEEYLEEQEEPHLHRILRFLNCKLNEFSNVQSQFFDLQSQFSDLQSDSSKLRNENNNLKELLAQKDDKIRELKAQNPLHSVKKIVRQSVNNEIIQTCAPRLEQLLQNKLEENLEYILEQKLERKLERKLEQKLESKLERKLENKVNAVFESASFSFYSYIRDYIVAGFERFCIPKQEFGKDISTILNISKELKNSFSDAFSDWYCKGVLITDITPQDLSYTQYVCNLANIMELGVTSTDIKIISHFEKNEKISVAVIFTTLEMKDRFLSEKERLDPHLSNKIFNFNESLTNFGYQINSNAGIYVKEPGEEESTRICCLYQLMHLLSANPKF